MGNAIRERYVGEELAETFNNIYSGGLSDEELLPSQPISTERWDQRCTVCLGDAVLVGKDLVLPPQECVDSLSCEVSWTALHPEAYIKDGEPDVKKLPCAGSRCDATLKLSCKAGQLLAKVVDGECTVDRENRRFKAEGRQLMNNMELDDHSTGIEDDSQPMRPVPGLVEREPGDPRTPEPPTHPDWYAL